MSVLIDSLREGLMEGMDGVSGHKGNKGVNVSPKENERVTVQKRAFYQIRGG